MRKSAIAVVTCIIIVITLVVFLPLKPGDIPPIIQDQVEVEDQVLLDVGTSVSDEPNLSDSADSSSLEEYEYSIDEEGNKHYVINAVDTPDIEG